MASSHIRSTAAKKSRVVPARCMYACTHWFLHLAATVHCASNWFLLMEPLHRDPCYGFVHFRHTWAHFLRVFPGSPFNCTLSTLQKIFGPRFGRRSTATNFGARFWNHQIWADQKSSARCSQITYMIICGKSYSLNCSQKEQGGSSSLHYACTLRFLHLANCGGPLCKGTFSTGFSGLVNEPAKPSKTVLHRDDFNRSCTLLLRLFMWAQ